MSFKVSLIPRYNWDYGFSDLKKAVSGIFTNNGSSPTTDDIWRLIFGQDPVFTTSGRTSLYVILKSLPIPEGSHVGVPLYCCPVVFDAVVRAHLIPKFIDIDMEDYNLSISDLERKKGTLAALVVVHMFGHPANMDGIRAVSGDIPVIEDCAQSLFSKYKGVYTGSLSAASFFSFRSGKYVSAGEGSAICCRDPSLRETISRLVGTLKARNSLEELIHCAVTFGKSSLYHRPLYGAVGYPLGRRLDRKLNLSAKTGFELMKISTVDLAIIRDRIEGFQSKINLQRHNSFYYLDHVRINDAHMPVEKDDCYSNFYQFAIRFETRERRDLVCSYLLSRGIDTAQYLDEVIDVAKAAYDYKGDCPNAERCSKTTLIIPNHYTLEQKDVEYIARMLNDFNQYFQHRRRSDKSD